MRPDVLVSRTDAFTRPGPWSACQEALTEVARGLVGLIVALFFFAGSGFDWTFLLAGPAIILTGGHVFLPGIAPELERAGLARQLRAAFGHVAAGWRSIVLGSLVVVFAALGVQRALSLRNGSISSTAGSEAERWLPLLFTALLPVWFVISGLLDRAPRHLLAGLIAAAGAVAGPLIGLAWRDSLALAAAVTGFVLIADGGIARRQTCHLS